MRSAVFFGCVLIALNFGSAESLMAADDYKSLFKAKKYAEIERLTSQQLESQPTDTAALIAKAKAILFSEDKTRIDQAVALSEQCVAAHPKKSDCHIILGTTLAAKALAAGKISGLLLAGKIRQAYQQAVALDEKNIEARLSLLRYYLIVPSIAGGGIEKAQELAQETLAIHAQAAQLMRGAISLREKQLAAAEAAVLSASAPGSPPLDETLTEMQRSLLIGTGSLYMEAKKYTDAERAFRTIQKYYPDSAWGPFLLARVKQTQGKCSVALPFFEKAVALDSEAGYIYFRMAECLELLNEKNRALAAFERSLAFKERLSEEQQKDIAARIKALKS